MPKAKTIFICQSCGAEFPKWQGKCFECGSWNSLVETVVSTRESQAASRKSRGVRQVEPQVLSKISTISHQRLATGFLELDRVLGGGPPAGMAGIVPGSIILLGGEPGIGKSTLLLQIAGSVLPIANRPERNGAGESPPDTTSNKQLAISSLYVSGEESAEQIKLRADRLGLDSNKILVLSETDVDVVGEVVSSLVHKSTSKQERKGEFLTRKLDNQTTSQLVIVDSIQALRTDDLTSAAGSISQVQECARRLSRIAKETNLPLFLVGHVTKEGAIAGPKTLTHLVDVVLYLEGERFSNFRILRGIKNRFGQTSEVGIFEMTDKGMKEVTNPSAEILGSRKEEAIGSVVTIAMEGQRPLLLEIQTLTSPTPFGLPRRTVNGVDYNRLLMLLAVLQRKAGFSFANQDVYVNVSGGFKALEPAVDLAICLSLASSLKSKALPKKAVALGEVGLLGEVKKPTRFEERVKEAKRLGFDEIIAYNKADSIKQAIAIGLKI